MLAKLQTPDGRPLDITLTTNGSLLKRKAQSLVDAGLQRVTVSLDGLDDAVFKQMNDVDFPVSDVLEGIAVAQAVGLGIQAPIKVNMVIKRGTNDDQILPMARHFKGSGVVLRYIEYMDVGSTNGWDMTEVMPSKDVIAKIHAKMPLVQLSPTVLGETSERWGYQDGTGEIGVISSVTQAFCADCNRARLSTEGKLYLCLFATQGHDLRSLLRDGASNDTDIASAVQNIWQARSDNYSELRASGLAPKTINIKRVEMSYIGG
jgi:cyclic pyranopterin phosphate synthase